MKAEISLERGVTTKTYWMVINNVYYKRLTRQEFYELAEFLKIEV